MKYLISLMVLVLACSVEAAFTEFYVRPLGDNLNSGSTTNDVSIRTYGGTFVRATGVFTCTNGEVPTTDLVTTNDWASIFTLGSTNTGFVARVLDTNDTTITVSLLATSGIPASVDESAGASVCKIGGAWKGPNVNAFQSAYGFPFGFSQPTMTNTSGDAVSINVLSAIYPTTNAITHTPGGTMIVAGYTNTPRDGGYFILSNANSAASIIVMTFNQMFYNMIVDANCSSGNNAGAAQSGGMAYRCVFKNAARSGIAVTGGALIECESYNNCRGNAAVQMGGFSIGGGGPLYRCYSHDNASGSSSDGFNFTVSGTPVVGCVAANNTGNGFIWGGTTVYGSLIFCDSYNNSSNGVSSEATTATGFFINNCNLVKNGQFGVYAPTTVTVAGTLMNIGIGTGTAANGSGSFSQAITNTVKSTTLLLRDIVYYPADSIPWTGAPGGNFLITLAQAKSSGAGTILTNTTPTVIGFPDIGSGQSSSTNASSSGGSYPFAQ